MKYSTVYILTLGGKVGQATNLTTSIIIYHLVRCISYALNSQSRDHDEVFP